MFSIQDGRVYVDTPWPRETVFTMDLLDAADWVHVERGEAGEPVQVLIAVANGGALYTVTRFDEWNGVVEVRLGKCSRTAHRPEKAKKKPPPEGRWVGFHSSTGCWGSLRERDGSVDCERCGWSVANTS